MVNLEGIAIVITGIIAIVKINQSINQNRNRDIVLFYEKSQEIRTDLNNIKPNEKERAQSLIIKLLNLYDVLSYSVLNSLIDEKDAFHLLKKNIFDVKEKFVKKTEDYADHKNIIQLYRRWDKWGLSQYYFKKIFYYALFLLSILFVLYLYIK